MNPLTYGQLIYFKWGNEKTVSSISGAGKIGQPHLKEWS